MTSDAMARDMIARARRCLREARTARDEGDHALCVRRSQEAIELAVKGLLRLTGVEFPREHDVSDVLLRSASRLPPSWRSDLPELARRMREITPRRGPAMYGLEAQGIPASDVFDDDDALAALADAEFVLSRCAAWLEEWTNRTR